VLKLSFERLGQSTGVFPHPFGSQHRARSALVVLAALLGGVVAGCVGEPLEKAAPLASTSPTSDESAIETLRRSATVAVVLFQTPTECLTCSADLNRWIELARESGGAFLIALSEEPSVEEAAAIRRMRLSFTVLRNRRGRVSSIVPPAIAVFRGDDTLIFGQNVTANRRSKLLERARRALQ